MKRKMTEKEKKDYFENYIKRKLAMRELYKKLKNPFSKYNQRFYHIIMGAKEYGDE